MKAKILFIFLTVLCLFTSCTSPANYGFPYNVMFGKEGGSTICSGTESFYHITISDYDGNGNGRLEDGENDTIMVSYEWLTVKFRKGMTEFKLAATPNTTGKKRTLYLDVAVDNLAADIKVTQR